MNIPESYKGKVSSAVRTAYSKIKDYNPDDFESLFSGKTLIQVVIGSIADRIKIKEKQGFRKEELKLQISAIIAEEFINKFGSSEEIKKDGDGFRKHVYINFPERPTVEKKLCLNPGIGRQWNGVRKLNSSEKKELFNRSVQGFRLRRDAVVIAEYGFKLEEKLMKNDNWDIILVRRKINEYINTIKEMQGSIYNLKMWRDYRGREYYSLNMKGINPQGRLWEVLQWELPEPIRLTQKGISVLKWIVTTHYKGRCLQSESEDKYVDMAIQEDPFSSQDPKEFGELLLIKRCAEAIKAGKTALMVGLDMTNSGLIIASAGFGSTKMLKASNLLDQDKIYDSHQIFSDGIGMTRDIGKKIHTEILHGKSFKSISKQLEMEQDDFINMMVKLYGVQVLNIDRIASWGTRFDYATWTMPDGIKAHHKGVMKGYPMRLFTFKKDETVRQTIVHRDMPLVPEIQYENAKLRGLFGNITHSYDAYILREVRRTGIKMITKHDDFIMHPNDFHKIYGTIRKALLKVDYQKAINEIAMYKGIEPITLDKGDNNDCIKTAINFLAP